MIDITKVVKIHFVVPDTVGELFNAHTHGLEKFGHKEFQVLVPGFCRGTACSILNGHADRVINRGESFVPGELGEIDGAVIGYEQVPGDFLGTPTLLRIVDMPSEYETGGPCVRQEESRAEEGR